VDGASSLESTKVSVDIARTALDEDPGSIFILTRGARGIAADACPRGAAGADLPRA
jgi:hypothetical protein